MKTFHDMVSEAINPLYQQEFMPSRLEKEQALMPVVECLQAMSRAEVMNFVKQSFMPGTCDVLCLSMYFKKEREKK